MRMIVLPNAFGDAATNMAIDGALLEVIPEETALFRHYAWTEPALTFGYSQSYKEVAATAPADLKLCRRATGGGIVDHRNDWTYTLLIASELPAARSPSTELYHKIHHELAVSILKQSVETKLAPCLKQCSESHTQTSGPSQCFARPAMNDVLTTDGNKIAGAAMKRTRKGLLIQGSIDRAILPETFQFDAFASHFTSGIAGTLELLIQEPEDLRPLFRSEIIEREKQRFGSREWTERR